MRHYRLFFFILGLFYGLRLVADLLSFPFLVVFFLIMFVVKFDRLSRSRDTWYCDGYVFSRFWR